MEILKVIKNKDGSINLECDCTEEEINFLASVGINTILKEYIEKKKEKEEI